MPEETKADKAQAEQEKAQAELEKAEEKRQKELEKQAKSAGGDELVDSLKDPSGKVHDSSTVHGEVNATSDIAGAFQPQIAEAVEVRPPSGTQTNPVDDNEQAAKAAEDVKKA